MKIILILGIIISLVGITGFLRCIIKGLKIKRIERSGLHNSQEIKSLLKSLYILNMASLASSFFGLMLVVIAKILHG